jgi:hypothetical protein
MIQIPNLSIWTQPITCNPLQGCPGVIQGLLINGAIDALQAAMKRVWHAVAIGVEVPVEVPCEALSLQLTWPQGKLLQLNHGELLSPTRA